MWRFRQQAGDRQCIRRSRPEPLLSGDEPCQRLSFAFFTSFFTVFTCRISQNTLLLLVYYHSRNYDYYSINSTCWFLDAPLACCETRLNQSGCRVCVCVCVCVCGNFFPNNHPPPLPFVGFRGKPCTTTFRVIRLDERR